MAALVASASRPVPTAEAAVGRLIPASLMSCCDESRARGSDDRKRGFTDRQARFLVLVARHSGVCVMRQYSSFAGIVFGQKTRSFFAKLVRLGFVSTYDCAHDRGRPLWQPGARVARSLSLFHTWPISASPSS